MSSALIGDRDAQLNAISHALEAETARRFFCSAAFFGRKARPHPGSSQYHASIKSGQACLKML
jgi:hypothetical protein